MSSKIHSQYTDYINWAIGIIFAVAAFILSKDILIDTLKSDVAKGILSIILLSVTGILVFLYASAVRTELDLLDEVLDSENIRDTEISGGVLLPMLGISVFLGLLIANVTQITYYAGIAAVYSIVDMYGQSLVIRNFMIQVQQKNYLINKPLIEEEVKILFDYYVGRPLLTRIALIFFLECVVIGISIYADFSGFIIWNTVAYIIMILTFVIGEIVMYYWRKPRNLALNALDLKRDKLTAVESS